MTDERSARDARDAERARDEIARLRAVMDALGMADPAPVEEPDAEAAEREIARIVALPHLASTPEAVERPADPDEPVDLAVERERRRGRRRWTAAVGAAAAVLIAFGMTMLPQGATEHAVASASPPLLALPIAPADLADGAGRPAHDALLALADVAGEQVDPAPAGRVQQTLTQSWFTTSTTDAGDATTVVEPTVRQSWIAADGSLVSSEWRGAPLGPEGQLEPVDTSPAAAAIDRVPAGAGFSVDAVTRLSDDPAVLRGELLALTYGLDCTGVHEAYCLYTAATGLASTYVLPSRFESALWQVLADSPEVTLAGDVTDRLGRRAVAVSVPGPVEDAGVTVRVLLIDVATGRLSGQEEVTLTSEVLEIDEPTVTLFSYIVSSAWVAQAGVPTDRPGYTDGLATPTGP
ncbi:MAG TPA: CU044_5270 family protein [Cellulomonas sp.]